ncbi:MAG TPA: ester cyclase [Actinomycetota bacterium]
MGENADTVRAIEASWDRGRLDELDQYFAPGFDNAASATPGVPPGLEGAKMAHQGVMQSFPDRKAEILDVVEGGDRVFVRSRVTGTNQGGFPAFNVPANGSPFQIEAWSVYRFDRDGKVVEHWGMNDGLMLLMQLGAIPAPGG